MAALTALFLLAAAPEAATPDGRPQFKPMAGATVSAQATVRILSGARVSLGRSADSGPYQVGPASVRIEDGSRQPAQLVEFQ